MGRAKRGSSPHTKRRHALQRIVELETQQAKLERSRPRTPGKKGAKTRALNAIALQLRAARGQLTKARNAIASGAAKHTSAIRAAVAKRSAAAKKGWATRRARAKRVAIPSALEPIAATGFERFMPHLTENGVIYVNPLGSDRSLEGKHWNAIRTYLENGRTDALDRFQDRSILDVETGRRLPFVTDPAVILEHEAEFDFGSTGFYKRREEVATFAA
jgi:hypothetical protein